MTQIRQERLADQIAPIVASRIAAGQIKEKAPSQAELCKEFGVSPPTARDALKQLETMRFIDVRAGRRARIRPERDWDYLNPDVLRVAPPEIKMQALLELLDVRLLLEPSIAGRACAEASPADIRKLTRLTDRMDDAESDPNKYAQLDIDFHIAVSDATANKLLTRLVSSLRGLQQVSLSVTNQSLGGISAATQHHKLVARAIADGDPEAAERVMREHIDLALNGLKRILSVGGDLATQSPTG